VRAALLASLLLLALGGCRSLGRGGGNELSYAQVQSIHVGLSAAQVTDAFGPPARADRDAEGRVRSMDYAALDGRGGGARLLLEFDEREVLVGKRFTGAVTKP
jgi:hypothetical protein